MSVGAPLMTATHASPEVDPMPSQPTCSVPGCNGRRRTRNWCAKHYRRWQRHGDPFVTMRPELGQTEAERFWSKVDKTGDCWLWTGSLTTAGYGQFHVGGRPVFAHRWAYEEATGPVPDGLQLDHLCRTRSCVRVVHLEPVTQRENILRGEGVSARNARKTHCKRGHEFTPENIYTRKDDSRLCRQCQRLRNVTR